MSNQGPPAADDEGAVARSNGLRAYYDHEYVERFEQIHQSTIRLQGILKLVELKRV